MRAGIEQVRGVGIGPGEGVEVLAFGQRADADVVTFFGRIVARAPPVEARQAIHAEPLGVIHVHAHEVVVQHGRQLAGGHAVVRGQQPAHPGGVVDLRGEAVDGLVAQRPQEAFFVGQDHAEISVGETGS